MATYTNTIILKSDAFKNASTLLKALDMESFGNNSSTKKISDENIYYHSSLNDDGLAIGFWKEFIILTGYRVTELIYDSINKRPSSNFKKIEQLFPKLDALLTFSNDTEMSFAFELIMNNKSIRKKQVFHGKLQESNDFGELLPSEVNYYTQLNGKNNTNLKDLIEYKSGYNDINISLSIIKDFCGEMPNFDSLRMNIDIEKDLGKDLINSLNEPFGDEKEKLEQIISIINSGLTPVKLKLKKYKQFPKLTGKATRHQPGCILKTHKDLQIIFRPIILCSYEVSVEIRLEIQFLDDDKEENTQSKLPNSFNFACFVADHIRIKRDYDNFLTDLKTHIKDFFIPVLNCTDRTIYDVLLNYCFSEQYFRMIILQAERNRTIRNLPHPYMYRFDNFVQLLDLRKIINPNGKEEVLKLFADYLKQYKSIMDNIFDTEYNNTKSKYNNFVNLFETQNQ